MDPSNLIIETLGWVGTITYLVAYTLISLKKREGDTTGLNAVWVAIGLFTLRRKWLTRN